MRRPVLERLFVVHPFRKDVFVKRNLYAMYALAFLQGMVFYAPVATLYRQAQGVSVFQITVMESISLTLGVLLEIPWGAVADKIGYRKTMIVCCWLYFASKIIFWRATGFGGFLLERILLGVILAGISGVDASILYLSCAGENSHRAFGIYSGMGMAGLLSAGVIFALFVRDDYRLAGLLTVFSYGAAAIVSLAITEVDRSAGAAFRPEPFRRTLQQTLRSPALLLFVIAGALLSETHQTVTVFLNQLQYDRCGLSDAAIGAAYIAASMLGLLGVCSAAVTRRMGVRRSVVLSYGLAVGACLTLALTQRAIPSILGILTLRAAHTLFEPLQAELQNRRIRSANRATALSVYAMLADCVAIGLGPVFGVLADACLPAAFGLGGILCAVGLLCIPPRFCAGAER